MSLLSSFDDISLLQPEEEETDSNKDKGEAPKLQRTNSLEDLGIKVGLFFYRPRPSHSERNANVIFLKHNKICLFNCAQDAAPSSSPKKAETKGKDEQPKENVKEEKKWAVPVNITSPCSDFHKRIPNPAFKVGLPLLLQHPTSGVCVHFFSPFFFPETFPTSLSIYAFLNIIHESW